MTAIRNGLSATVLGTALLLGTGVPNVIAQTTFVTADVNQRTGPGVQYSAVRTLPQGTAVELVGCQGSWCRISYNGNDGWVAARYLNQQGSGGATGTGGSAAPTLAPAEPAQAPADTTPAPLPSTVYDP